MKNTYLISVMSILLFCIENIHAQTGNVGIGTTNPDYSAILDLTSTDKGILIPRITDTNMVSSPATGLLIYLRPDKTFYYFDGTWWRRFGGKGLQGPTGLQGATGTNGIDGTNGLQGPTGLQGAAGTNGTNGAQGPTGYQGAAGTNGIDGANGLQGPTGLQGATGVNGTNGINGAQGPTGTQGPIGVQGAQGPQGNPGTNSSNGCDCPTMISSESPQLNFYGALTYCENLNESSNSDWYLPSLQELLKLTSGKAVIPDTRTNNYLWTTTPGINGANHIKVVKIGASAGIWEWNGGLSYARCVR